MKKPITLLLTIIMLMSVGIGCTKPKSAREILSDALVKARQLKTLSSMQVLTAKLTFPKEVLAQEESASSVVEAINNSTVLIDIKQDLVNHLSNGKITVSQSGLDFGFDLFVEPDSKVYLKTPFSDKYIVQQTNLNHISTLLDGLRDKREIIDQILLESIEDSQLSVEYDVAYNNNGTTLKLHYVTISFTNEQLYHMIMELAKAFKNDTELLGVLTKWTYNRLTAQALTVDYDMSEETVLKEIEAKIELIKQKREDVIFDNVTLKIGVNQANDIIDSLTSADIRYLAEGKTYQASFHHNAQNYAIDQHYEAISIEINKDNSIELEDFIMQILFSNGLSM